MEDKMRAITPNHDQIRCEVVTTYEQVLHACAIRSICFMEVSKRSRLSTAATTGRPI